MGNTHSTESLHDSHVYGGSTNKRSPHKLSKPRISSYATPSPPVQPSGMFSASDRAATSSLPPSRSNSHPTPQTLSSTPSPAPEFAAMLSSVAVPSEVPSPVAEPESRPAKDWKRRASLFRSKSTQGPRKDRRRESIMLSPPVPDRMSRANSMTWESQMEMDNSRQVQVESWHIPGNRQSINYNLMSYESRRLLNLSEQLTSCQEDSIMSEDKFQVSQNTWKSSHPHQPASVQIPRVNSDVSLYAPVRRRSMIQTPGLATRMPMEYSASRRSSVRYSLPPTPAGGCSRLNSMESHAIATSTLADFVSQPEYLSMPVAEPVERALTPSDMDYRPLGSMKFGSLRITNGAASPLPSPDFEPQAKAEMVEKPQELEGEDYFFYDSESGRWECSNKAVEITLSQEDPAASPRVLGPIRTSSLGVDSQKQRAHSPLSPELKIASKHTAAENDVQMEYSTEVLTVRNDPNAKPSLEQLQADKSQKNSRAIVRADSGVVASPTSEHQPKSLSKADSGYSSNVSLRSFHAKHPAGAKKQHRRALSEDSEDEQSDSIPSPIAAVSNESPSTALFNADNFAPDVLGSASPTSLPPPPPPKDDFLGPPASNTMAISSPKFFLNLSAGHSFRKDRRAPAAINSVRKADNGPESPESVQSSGAISDKSNSALSIGSGLQQAGKLKRLLTGAGMRGPPAVHATHPSDEQIPFVPQDVQAKLDEHSGLFPMTTKRLTLRAQASKDTLKTILSVGSVDAGYVEDKRDPTPKIAGSQVEGPKTPRRLSFQSVPTSFAQAAALMMPKRPIHRKPLPSTAVGKAELVGEARADEIQVGFESRITSIGHVGESVGKSAFDQAFMTMPRGHHFHAPQQRTFTMTAQMERDIGMRFNTTEPMPLTPLRPDFLTSQGLQIPEISPKKRSPPPVSLHTRNGKNASKPVSARPQSASSSEASQSRWRTLSRQSSRETIHSYPSAALNDSFSVPPVPALSPQRSTAMFEQQFALRRLAAEDKWRPTNRDGIVEHGQDAHARPATQGSFTATPAPHYQQLRHRSSYESYSHSRGPVARGHSSISLGPSQTGSYYQQQLLNIQQHQWEQPGHQSFGVAQQGLSRSRSRGRSVHAQGNPPYRVLHSYNSPAYRNAPIWG
ncbi:hypothetical protein EsH8_III_001052 [Colletotrichum jinshuiense]